MKNRTGALYAFQRGAANWQFSTKYVTTGTNARVSSDQMGENNLNIYNDTLIVGTSQQDYDENGANLVSNAGAAYIFKY